MKTNNNNTGNVLAMRQIRDTLSLEIMDMSFEQEKEYIKTQLAKLKAKRQITN